MADPRKRPEDSTLVEDAGELVVDGAEVIADVVTDAVLDDDGSILGEVVEGLVDLLTDI